LNIEVAELQELLLWKDEEQEQNINKAEVAEEIADVGIFLIYLCEHYGIDFLQAIENKLEENGKKYPIEKSLGSNKKYTEFK